LWLAGPTTGHIVQPIIDAKSDRTVSKLGKRTPHFLIGAMLCIAKSLFSCCSVVHHDTVEVLSFRILDNSKTGFITRQVWFKTDS
jgi:hypothetical protein